MQEWLTHFASSYPYLVYGVIALISFVEGPILAMVCGLLLRLGSLPFWPVYIALMAGDLFGDVFWYCIGYYVGHPFIKKAGRFFGVTENGVEQVKKVFHRYKNWILLISKVTMGFGFALVTLVTAGIVRIPFKRYITLNFIGQFIWTGFLLIIGYYLGNWYLTVNNILGKISIFALIIIVFLLLLGYGKYVKNSITAKLRS